MGCNCAACRAEKMTLGQLSEDELAQLDTDLRRLSGFLKSDEDWEELDIGLDETDADIMSSIIAVFGGEAAKIAVRQKNGLQVTDKDAEEAALRMQEQLTIGLALLSTGAASRLAPVLDQLNGFLADAAKASQNGIQLGQQLQNLLEDTAIAGSNRTFDPGVYSPYEWSRLCRTEMVFARSAAERETLQQEWGADPAALDFLGWPPLHPQCMCSTTVWVDGNDKAWIVVVTTPSACEECNDWADMVLDFVGA